MEELVVDRELVRDVREAEEGEDEHRPAGEHNEPLEQTRGESEQGRAHSKSKTREANWA
jgi:hypothetical protein